MESEITVELVEQLVEKVFVTVDADPEKLEQLERFTKDPSSIAICEEILKNQNNSTTFRSFAANTLFRMTNLYVSTWNTQDSLQLCDWTINYMMSNSDSPNKKQPYSSLASVVASILEHFVIRSKADFNNQWKNITTIFEYNPSDWIIGLHLLSAIYDQFMESENEEVKKLFEKDYITKVFQLSYSCLQKIQKASGPVADTIIDLATSIIRKYLYEQSNYCEFKNENVVFMSASSDRALDAQLEQITLFFNIFKFNRDRKNVLQCLKVIAKNIDSYSSQWRPKLLSYICNLCISENIIAELDSYDETIQISILSILAAISKHFSYSVLSQINDLDIRGFLAQMEKATSEILTESHSLKAVKTVMNFWTNFEKALRNDGNVKEKNDLAAYAPNICSKYTQLLLELALSPDKDTGVIYPQNISSITEVKLSPYIMYIENFVILNPDTICPMYIKSFENALEHLRDAIKQGLSTVQAEMELAFFVEAATIIIRIKKLNGRSNPLAKYQYELFYNLINLLLLSDTLAKENLSRLEMSLVLFINEFKSTPFNNTELEHSKKLYLELTKKKCIIHGCKQCQTYLFERLFSTLRNYGNSKFILEKALTIIQSDDSIAYLLNQINDQFFDDIFSSPLEESFPFMSNFEFKSVRSRFYSTIYYLLAKMEKIRGQKYFNILLEHFDSRFSFITVDSNPNDPDQLKTICWLAIDLTGMFNCIKIDYQFTPLFDWFSFPNRVNAFLNSFQPICQTENYVLINCILKMWISIVLCTPLKRISFPDNSANGIRLFKMAASTLLDYSYFIESQTDDAEHFANIAEPLFKGIKYYSIILQNLLCGKYVLFDAIKIYDDTIFIDLLQQMAKMFQNIDFQNMSHYPRVLREVIRMFRDLFANQLPTLFECPDLLAIIFKYSFELLSMHKLNDSEFEEPNELAIEILDDFLTYIYDEALDYHPFQEAIKTINNIAWFLITKQAQIDPHVVQLIKDIYLIDPMYFNVIHDEIKKCLVGREFSLLDSYLKQMREKLTEYKSETSIDVLTPIIQEIYLILRPYDIVFV